MVCACYGAEFVCLTLRMTRFDTNGLTATTKSLSLSGGSGGGGDSLPNRKTISSIKDEGLGFQEKPDYISVKATVSFIKHDSKNWFYTACEFCRKKVTQVIFVATSITSC